METLNSALLRQKPAVELFQMRQRVVNELRVMNDGAQGREPTADERPSKSEARRTLRPSIRPSGKFFALVSMPAITQVHGTDDTGALQPYIRCGPIAH
jgi:hypothetical protein